MGKLVLVADDDRMIRTLLKDALGTAGYEFVEAESGEEALATYVQQKPDLVLIDLMMPNKSGIEALSQIRAHDPESRVVVVTSLEVDSLRKEALEKGAVGFVVKPFHPMEIVDAAERALKA